ncbi:MAG: SRPBCC domain-containing protein [Conexivisphaerales archaeon]
MKIEGREEVIVNPDEFWSFLSTPEKVVKCVPGAQSWTIEKEIIHTKIKVGVGFIKGTFDTTTKILKNDIEHKVAELEISGVGNMGNFSATVNILLTPASGNKYLVSYSSEAKVSGTMGTLAAPIVNSAIKNVVKDFLKCAENGGKSIG